MLMRIRWACGGIALLLTVSCPLIAGGQVSVHLKLPLSKVLLYEPIIARVTIGNTSGRTLSFDSERTAAKFRFDIEDEAGKTIKSYNAGSMLSGVSIMPDETRVFEVVLSKFYGIQAARAYKIRAAVEWGSASYGSSIVWLYVVRGFELARVKAGIPGDEGAIRTYVLEYLQREKAEYLYLRIDDDRQGIVYGVFNLGQLVRVRKPMLRVDEPGNVHVLFQTKGMNFVHAAYTPYGVQLLSENIVGGKMPMTFRQLPSGQLVVVAGALPEENLGYPVETGERGKTQAE